MLNRNLLLGAIFLTISPNLLAQELAMPKEVTPEIIEKIQYQKRMEEAFYELEEVQKKRQDLKGGGEISRPSITGPKFNVSGAEPLVVSIEGKTSDLRATLMVGQGQTIKVKAGNQAAGWQIVKIESDGVIASKNGVSKFLAFAEAGYTAPQASVPQMIEY